MESASTTSIETKVDSASSVDILILGAGWTSTFLIPLIKERHLSYAATSRSGKTTDTIPFTFDSTSDDITPYKSLPTAKTVLITFPIVERGGTTRLIQLYTQAHGSAQFIQLGTTGIWGDSVKDTFAWYDRHSPYERLKPRVHGEEELLSLGGTVLNLAGLWGGSRHMKNYVDRVAPSKEALKAKGSIHLIHGHDVARAVLAIHASFSKAKGERWLLTDMRVYDWWDLAALWSEATGGKQAGWVRELMEEENVRALPRAVELTGRALDAREFWRTFGLSPSVKLD